MKNERNNSPVVVHLSLFEEMATAICYRLGDITSNLSEISEKLDGIYLNTLHTGDELRDMFAAQAMQALINNGLDYIDSAVAKSAYQMADAMMEAREK